jgi:hypothetical protein
MDVFDDAFFNFAQAHESNEDPRRTPEEEQQVAESLREAYPKVKHYYPIYSDTEDAWQADLTFSGNERNSTSRNNRDPRD